MKYLLIGLLILFSRETLAQTFFADGMVYYNIFIGYGSGSPVYSGVTDTIRYDSSAAGFEYYSLCGWGKQRIKTSGRKVWFYHQDKWNDIYDFNLKAGDTSPYFGHELGDSVRIVIDSTDATWMGGRRCAVQYAHPLGGCDGQWHKYTFIEHYGSLDAGIKFWNKFCFEFSSYCMGICENGAGIRWDYSNRWDYLRIAGLDSTYHCDSLDAQYHLAKTYRMETPSMQIFPNPVSDAVHVQFPTTSFRKINFYDSRGRLELTEVCYGKEAYIPLPELAPGIYFIRSSDGFFGKILKE